MSGDASVFHFNNAKCIPTLLSSLSIRGLTKKNACALVTPSIKGADHTRICFQIHAGSSRDIDFGVALSTHYLQSGLGRTPSSWAWHGYSGTRDHDNHPEGSLMSLTVKKKVDQIVWVEINRGKLKITLDGEDVGELFYGLEKYSELFFAVCTFNNDDVVSIIKGELISGSHVFEKTYCLPDFTHSGNVKGLMEKNTYVLPTPSLGSSGGGSSSRAVITVAGTGVGGLQNGPGLSASFYGPCGIVVDKEGSIIVSDGGNYCIRKISSEGIVFTLAGGGTKGYNDGQDSQALSWQPCGLALDQEGNVLVADRSNHRILKVTSKGVMTILAGSGSRGFKNGKRTNAQFNNPLGLAVDEPGNVFVADFGNNCIRKVTPQGEVLTVAGRGEPGCEDGQESKASFNGPCDVAMDKKGNIVVTDFKNHRIRLIDAQGVVSTLAGSIEGLKDGQGMNACFKFPRASVVDACGNVLVADAANRCIRMISSQGAVSTVMKMDASRNIQGLALDGDQNLLFTDSNNNKIYRLVFQRKFIRGPSNSAFSGGMFELIISDLACSQVRFAAPIFHCNVDAQSGEIGFTVAAGLAEGAKLSVIVEMVEKLLEMPDVAPSAIKNQAAFTMWKQNRLEYNSRARKEAADSWQRLFAKDIKVLPSVLEVLLPAEVLMDRRAQHQIFSQLALVEIEKHLVREKQKRKAALLTDPEHKLNAGFMNLHIATMEQEETDEAEANMLRATLPFRSSKTLQELTTLESLLHVKKMEWLEKRLVELYLSKLVPEEMVGAPAGAAVVDEDKPDFIERVPSTRAECFAMMSVEATKEQGRLAKLIKTCMEKYELLYGRFDELKKIELVKTKGAEKEQKQAEIAVMQPVVVSSEEYYIAQAKLLEAGFRARLQALVDTFNAGKLPAVLAGNDNNNDNETYGSMTSPFTALRMISGLHASVLFGPAKSSERVRQKKRGEAHKNCDYLRATIVMADPLLLALCYHAMMRSGEFKVRKVKNKHNSKELEQPPNLHVNVEYSKHVCEVQFILEDFYLIKKISHKSYEIARVSELKGELLEEAVSKVVVGGVYIVHGVYEV